MALEVSPTVLGRATSTMRPLGTAPRQLQHQHQHQQRPNPNLQLSLKCAARQVASSSSSSSLPSSSLLPATRQVGWSVSSDIWGGSSPSDHLSEHVSASSPAAAARLWRGRPGVQVGRRSRFAGLMFAPGAGEQRRRGLVVRAAVFDQLSSNLEQVWTKLKSQDKLTRDNVKEPMRDIRRALLEADVSLPVVRRFVKDVSEKAVGTEVIRGVRPDQQLVKVVNDELVTLMGGSVADVTYAPPGKGPTVVLLAGLQGVGKTTACGKLALFFKKREKSCMMIATDIYRPAAIDQLHTLGNQVGVPVFSLGTTVKPPEIAKRGIEEAKKQGVEVVIIDTAGRLQIDRSMMDELKDIKKAVQPNEILLVVDAMTGQEAAGLVSSFNQEVGITGAILTKLDGDSRGGAALSVKEVSGRPIKFVGEGEGMNALEPFYPDRMASRILGMGDVLSFVEKAQEAMAKEDAEEIQKKIMDAQFDFNDFLKQTRMIARMGSMGGLVKLIPGMSKVSDKQIRDAEKNLRVMESMINSMTAEERKNPELLAKSPSRRRRIARGSGRTQEQVSGIVSQLFQMRIQMKAMADMMAGKAVPNIPGLDTSGQRKAAPGTAKRRRSKTAPSSGFAGQLTLSGSGAKAKSSGFGARK